MTFPTLPGGFRLFPGPLLGLISSLGLAAGAGAALSEPLAPASFDASCVYFPRPAEGEADAGPATFEACGRERGDGTAELRPEHLAALDFNAAGLASLRLGEHFYYFRRDGRSARVPAFDNWADDFSCGRVRTVRTVDGVEKFGYVDLELAVVIPVRFDGAFPFESGRATVCLGCSAEAPDGDGHRVVSGGLWGSLDEVGAEVEPIRSSRDDLMKRTDRH